MKIFISFAEISAYVLARYGKRVALSGVGENKIKIVYTQDLKLGEINLPVGSLTIRQAQGSAVVVSLSGSTLMNKLITTIFPYVKRLNSEIERALTISSDGLITIDLTRVASARALAENISLNNIQVRAEGVEITASLRASE